MAEPTHGEVLEAVGELRRIVDTKNAESSEYKEKFEKINVLLDAQEEINQKNMREIKSAETKEAETKERIDALEIELARSSEIISGKDYHENPRYKALEAFAKSGDDLDLELKAILRTDIDTDGGYTVMGEMDNMIIKKITEISGVRSVASVRTTSSKSLNMPTRTGILTASFEGEGGTSQESNSNYGQEMLVPWRQTVTVPITRDLLMDSSFNMESEIFGDASEAFAQGEGLNFISGDGVKKPQGVLIDPTVAAGFRTSTTSGTIDADDMILLTGDLKVGYNPIYAMSRGTLAILRTKKSTDGQFLWQPGMNGPAANNMNGFGYILCQDLPAVAANSLSVIFGDFQRGYKILDRTGVSVIRDEVTRKKQAIVEFTINRWLTGKVVLPEAFKLLKTKA